MKTRVVAYVLFLILLMPFGANADNYSITPLFGVAYLTGINDAGAVVGAFSGGPSFLYENGAFTLLPPQAGGAGGINNNNVIFTGGTNIGNPPPLPFTANGIQFTIVVGHPTNTMGEYVQGGFLYGSNGIPIPVSVPGSTATVVSAVNDLGQATGTTFLGGHPALFIYHSGSYTLFAPPPHSNPSTESIQPVAINNLGQVIGTYVDTDIYPHGFSYAGGVFSNLFYNDRDLTLFGINDSGLLIGQNYPNPPFIAFPVVPEPTAMELVAVGLGVLALATGSLPRSKRVSREARAMIGAGVPVGA